MKTLISTDEPEITFKFLKKAGLFYTDSLQGSTWNYTDSITGDLDLEKLLENDPRCWREQRPEEGFKKKVIIITDLISRFRLHSGYYSSNESYSPPIELAYWQFLLEHGFTIYVWTGNLECLTKENLYACLLRAEPIHPDILLEKIAVKGLTKQGSFLATTQIMFDVWLDLLKGGDFCECSKGFMGTGNFAQFHHPFNLSNLLKLPENLLKSYLDSIDITNRNILQIDSLFLCNYQNVNYYGYLEPILKNNEIALNAMIEKDIVWEDSYYARRNMMGCIQEFLLDNPENLPVFLRSRLTYIKLHIDSTKFSEKKICQFLNKLTHLKSIEIVDANERNLPEIGLIDLESHILQSLETFIYRGKLTDEAIQKIKREAPFLKTIHVQGMVRIFSPVPYDLPHALINLLKNSIYYERTELIDTFTKKTAAIINELPGPLLKPNGSYPYRHLKATVPVLQADRKCTMDANTGGSGTLKGKQYFYYKNDQNPHPADYRITCIDAEKEGEGFRYIEPQAFKLQETPLKKLEDLISDYRENYHESADLFLGIYAIKPYHRNRLPSLGSNEKIMGLATKEGTEITLEYDEESCFFYATPTGNQELNLYFILKVQQVNPPVLPVHLAASILPLIAFMGEFYFTDDQKYLCHPRPDAQAFLNTFDYHQKTHALVAFLRTFQQEKLNTTNQSDKSYLKLNQMIAEKKGVCRHRVFVALALAPFLGIKLRGIWNDFHAFIEVYFKENGWVKQDLGGGQAADLQIEPCQPLENGESQTPDNMTDPEESVEADCSIENPYTGIRKTKTFNSLSFAAFCKELRAQSDSLLTGKKNVLIYLKPELNESLQNALHQFQLQNQNKFCYIADLHQISLEQNIIHPEGHIVKKATALKTVISDAKKQDLLLIDCNDFRPEHSYLNSLLDTDQRLLKGIAVSENLVIAGLLSPEKTLSRDMMSRFHVILHVDTFIEDRILIHPVSRLTPIQDTFEKVDCFLPSDWKSLLKADINLQNNRFRMGDSALAKAIKAGKKGLVIRNLPLDDQELRYFLNSLLTARQWVSNGVTETLPRDFDLVYLNAPYLEPDFLQLGGYTSASGKSVYLLNSENFYQFHQWIVCKNGQLSKVPGLIARVTELQVVVDKSILPGQFALFQKLIGEYQRPITYYPAKGLFDNKIYVGEDLDWIEASLNLEKRYLTIPVSVKTAIKDLVCSMQCKETPEGKYYHYQSSFLLDQLKAGEAILLKGAFSSLLAKQLSTLLLPQPYLFVNGEYFYFSAGQIKIITPLENPFSFASPARLENASFLLLLENTYPLYLLRQAQALWDNFPLKKPGFRSFISVVESLQKDPFHNPFKKLFRLAENYLEIKPLLEHFFPKHNLPKLLSVKANIVKKRIDKILDILQTSLFVFIVGESGVGKSRLIQKDLKNHTGGQVFTGLESIEDWASYQGSQMAFLFIDEANLLSEESLAIFEGLYCEKPGILIKGQWLHLNTNQKVIFAGNYGHFTDRIDHQFFKRYGNIMVMKELPDNFLRKNIVKPLLSGHIPDKQLDGVCQLLVNTYKQSKTILAKDRISTPRNLEMLVWRFLSYHKSYPKMKLNAVAILANYDEFYRKTPFKDKFLQKNAYQEAKSTICQMVYTNPEKFILTKTRITPLYLLHQFLAIRQLKSELPVEKYFTGKLGIIFEGATAEGKSIMVNTYMESLGFVKADAMNAYLSKRYYLINNFNTLNVILKQAFHEGSIVIIDEINTIHLERQLNCYFSGLDEEGNKPRKPGFMIIGSQNPVYYDNRYAFSEALANRFQLIPIKDYQDSEIKTLAQTLIVDRKEADKESDHFLSAREKARRDRKEEPTVRDLIIRCKKRTAELALESEKNKKQRVDEEFEELTGEFNFNTGR